MVGTLCASGAAIAKAGAGMSSTINTLAGAAAGTFAIDDWIEEAEGYLSALTKTDLVAGWSATSGASTAPMLTEYCSRQAAIEAIKYNMSGYTSRVEAEDLMNIHLFRMNEIVKILNQASVQDFMGV